MIIINLSIESGEWMDGWMGDVDFFFSNVGRQLSPVTLTVSDEQVQPLKKSKKSYH